MITTPEVATPITRACISSNEGTRAHTGESSVKVASIAHRLTRIIVSQRLSTQFTILVVVFESRDADSSPQPGRSPGKTHACRGAGNPTGAWSGRGERINWDLHGLDLSFARDGHSITRRQAKATLIMPRVLILDSSAAVLSYHGRRAQRELPCKLRGGLMLPSVTHIHDTDRVSVSCCRLPTNLLRRGHQPALGAVVGANGHASV